MNVEVVPPIGASHLGFISQEHFPNEFTSGDGKKGMFHEFLWCWRLQLRSGPHCPLPHLPSPGGVCPTDHVCTSGRETDSSRLSCPQRGSLTLPRIWIGGPELVTTSVPGQRSNGIGLDSILPRGWHEDGPRRCGGGALCELPGCFIHPKDLTYSSLLSLSIPPSAVQMLQITSMDCAGILEAITYFDLRAGVTSPLLVLPLWPGIWEGGTSFSPRRGLS